MNPSPIVVAIQAAAALISLAAVLVALWVANRSDRQRKADREMEARAHAIRVRAQFVRGGDRWGTKDKGWLTNQVVLRVQNASPESVLMPIAFLVRGDDTVADLGVRLVGALPLLILPGETCDLDIRAVSSVSSRDVTVVREEDLDRVYPELRWVDVGGRTWAASFDVVPVLELVDTKAAERVHGTPPQP